MNVELLASDATAFARYDLPFWGKNERGREAAARYLSQSTTSQPLICTHTHIHTHTSTHTHPHTHTHTQSTHTHTHTVTHTQGQTCSWWTVEKDATPGLALALEHLGEAHGQDDGFLQRLFCPLKTGNITPLDVGLLNDNSALQRLSQRFLVCAETRLIRLVIVLVCTPSICNSLLCLFA